MTSNVSDLVKEYRPTMDKDILHSWAKDILASLTPAEQCFSVKEWYCVEAHDTNKNPWLEVPLTEALTIRSAEEVRREAVADVVRLLEKIDDLRGADTVQAHFRFRTPAPSRETRPTPSSEPVDWDQIEAEVSKFIGQALSDYDVAEEIYRNDPDFSQSVHALVEFIQEQASTPQPDKPCKTCKGTGYTDAVIDDRCGRCGQTGIEPSTDKTPSVAEAAKVLLDARNPDGMTVLPDYVRGMLRALATQTGGE